jgi:hypothetical protein
MKRLILFFLILFLQENLSARLPDLIPYRKGNLWGYCDSTKKIVIEPKYERTYLFCGSTAIIRENGYYGLIDTSGKIVLPAIYLYLDDQPHDGKRIAGILNGKEEVHGLIDENGKVLIPFIAMYIIWESENYLSVIIKGNRRANKLAVYDANGKIILPFEYLGWDYGAGTCGEAGRLVVVSLATKNFMVFDTTASLIFEGKYEMIWYEKGVFECIVNRDSTVYYDVTGKNITDTYMPFPWYRVNIQNEVKIDLTLISESYYERKRYIEKDKGYIDIHGTEYWEE